jgi:hypothetical protein
VEACSIGALKVELDGGWSWEASGDTRHGDKGWRRAGCGWRRLGPYGHVFHEVTGRQAPVLSHPTAGQPLGQSGGLIPQVLGNACRRGRTGLTPVCTLARHLVALVVGMERGMGG